MRRGVAAVAAACLLVGGLAVGADARSRGPNASPVRPLNDIRQYTTYVDCDTPAPDVVQGTFRIYLTYLQDYTPSPDKSRLLYFVVQNRFNHTLRVEQIINYPRSGAEDWWVDRSFVLTPPATSGTHQAGNGRATYAGSDWDGVNGHGALPWRAYQPQQPQGTSPFVYVPPWNVPNDLGTRGSPGAVAAYTPMNHPWWTEDGPYGPYLWVNYYVQGHYDACAAWYP